MRIALIILHPVYCNMQIHLIDYYDYEYQYNKQFNNIF